MPFTSKRQQRAAFGGHIPGFSKEKALEWAHETPDLKDLPDRAPAEKGKPTLRSKTSKIAPASSELRRALGRPDVTGPSDGPTDFLFGENKKSANGDMAQYFMDHPDKLREKKEREEREKKANHKLHGETKFRGLDIAIENKKGSKRYWHDPHGKEKGSTLMHYDYGYIRLTEGTDGDHVDVYLGPDADAADVFIVDQMKKPDFKEFDEQKCMLGFKTEAEAKAAYLKQYNDPKFFGSIKAMPFEEFKMKVLDKKNHGQKIATAKVKLSEGDRKSTIADRLDDLGIGVLAAPYAADTLGHGLQWAGDKAMTRSVPLGSGLAMAGNALERAGKAMHHSNARELLGLGLVAPGVVHSLAHGVDKIVPKKPEITGPQEPLTAGQADQMVFKRAEEIGRFLAREKGALDVGGLAGAVGRAAWRNRGTIAGLGAVGAVGAGLLGAKKTIDTATNLATASREPARYPGVLPGMRPAAPATLY